MVARPPFRAKAYAFYASISVRTSAILTSSLLKSIPSNVTSVGIQILNCARKRSYLADWPANIGLIGFLIRLRCLSAGYELSMWIKVCSKSRIVLYASDRVSSFGRGGKERKLAILLWSKMSTFRFVNFSRCDTALIRQKVRRVRKSIALSLLETVLRLVGLLTPVH
jgi:hypothetical protein